MERELDLQGGILPRKVKERMARFFTDSADASIGASGNLLDLGLDSDAIMTVRRNKYVLLGFIQNSEVLSANVFHLKQ